MATMNLHYFSEEGVFDRLFNQRHSDFVENGLDRICSDIIPTDLDINSQADLCVRIVEDWLKLFGHPVIDIRRGEFTAVPGYEAAEIDKKYRKRCYWLGVLRTSNLSPEHWDNLFQNDAYRTVDVANEIPDDRIQRLVFHFLYDWKSKFRTLFLDNRVTNEQKLAVLRKQLENILYIGCRRLQGGTWHMQSTPNDYLRQALGGKGRVFVIDDKGNQLRTISGQLLTATADGNIPQDAADRPRPDEFDKMFHAGVLAYARRHYPKMKNLEKWTMVRASFKYKADDEERGVRCYAFSGTSCERRSIPASFWKNARHNDTFVDENGLRDVFVSNGEENHLGQDMVMSIFKALRPFYEKDFRKLATDMAFENYHLAEATVQSNRNDLTTLDYGEYHGTVLDQVNKTCLRIAKIVNKLLQLEEEDKLPHELTIKLTCGEKNQQYKPNVEGLDADVGNILEGKNLDHGNILSKIKKVSTDKLSYLSNVLNDLPSEHLRKLEKTLSADPCGEDNVLPLLLGKMLNVVQIFLDTPVTFIALDEENPGGKPFCERCGKKVRFFSILPSILRSLGALGEDNVFEELKKLFSKMNEQV